jgi:hypothetical protein
LRGKIDVAGVVRRHGRLVFTFGILVFSLLGAAACSSVYPGGGEFHGQPIVIAKSDKYNAAIEKMPISQGSAREAARLIEPNVGMPALLIGHTYVFSAYGAMAYVPLSGVYVDGESGNARRVKSNYVVRFGLFGEPYVEEHN